MTARNKNPIEDWHDYLIRLLEEGKHKRVLRELKSYRKTELELLKKLLPDFYTDTIEVKK